MNGPQSGKQESTGIELVSFHSGKAAETEGIENVGLTSDEELPEETLSPGDLMAFAWQVAEGMVSI